MQIKKDTLPQIALDQAVDAAGGKTALMRKLNERGHAISSHNTISQWRVSGTPDKYCPDIEDITSVRCEQLSPKTNWSVLRGTQQLNNLDKRNPQRMSTRKGEHEVLLAAKKSGVL